MISYITILFCSNKMEVEYRSNYKNSGRKPGIISFLEKIHNSKEYIVGTIQFNGEDINFVIDKDDYHIVSERAWHLSSGKYISSAFQSCDGLRRELYLHNLIMGVDLFPGKGAKQTVDHINRNTLDNRKENLRIITQSQQNINQCKKQRNVILPEGCGIQPNDIPKHIWYVRAQGNHGDRFAIEFKTENICWKTTSSKKVSLVDKLNEAKVKLEEFYLQYPYLNPNYEENKIKELNESFLKIIQL